MLFTPTVLSPTSSAATSICKIAGQPRIRRRQRRRSTARATTAILQVKRACERGSQVISTRYPFRMDTGFLMRKRWEWMGFLARWAV